jgi:hypothetical protein
MDFLEIQSLVSWVQRCHFSNTGLRTHESGQFPYVSNYPLEFSQNQQENRHILASAYSHQSPGFMNPFLLG